MEWFQGGIAEAVTQSRRNGLIFVVFIDGHDENAKSLLEAINTPEISQLLLKPSHFVAIKVDVQTVPHQQFLEIYRDATGSSIYFIGKTGVPLEIVKEATNTNDMRDLVNSALTKDGKESIEATQDLINMESANEVQEDKSANEVKEDKSANEVKEDKSANEVQEDTSATEVQAGAIGEEAQPSLSSEEKMRLAQEIIEKKREQKKAEDEEKEKQNEMDRRKVGQDVQKLKRWQQEQELKQMLEERQKAKREEQEARDKVRRQIEEDKREKAARQQTANQNVQPATQSKPSRPVNSDTARLQFRLPDGSSHTHDFASSIHLEEVLNYIKANLNLTFNNFVLSTTFPRREFTVNDNSQSLLDLQLVPNAVVLILPRTHTGSVATATGDGIVGMVWYVLGPILNFVSYIKQLIFGNNINPSSQTNNTTANKRPSPQEDPAAGTSKGDPKRHTGKVRRYGNIHRLKDGDSDDENNTWNGNSTQQM